MMKAASAYQEAVSGGRYGKGSGLLGKYDNVRVYWEDWVTGYFVIPHLEKLVEQARQEGRGLRVLDLGCGSGDGYDLLTTLPSPRAGWVTRDTRLLPPSGIEYYLGIDLNEELLEQGRRQYGTSGKVEFARGDFCQGLPVVAGEEGYDLYFTSYGSFSHCNDGELEVLLAEIARQARPGALIVADWLGRYAYEWQELWTHDVDAQPAMDYVISYLSTDQERQGQQFTSFPLRLMTRAEARRVVERAGARSSINLVIEQFSDRSLCIGRHMETQHYNQHARPLRRAVNSLLEPGVRTELGDLRWEYHPREGFAEQNRYLADLAGLWNGLVDFTTRLLEALDAGRDPQQVAVSPGLTAMAGSLQQAAAVAGKMAPDARAWLVERQLALSLRQLEISWQPGEGLGHGFMGIIRVDPHAAGRVTTKRM